MSDQLKLWHTGPGGFENNPDGQSKRVSLAREMAYLLTSSEDASRGPRLSPSGVAHSFGVCLIEDWHMSRGKGKGDSGANGNSMPRFVDIKLTAEDRKAFASYSAFDRDPVRHLQAFADAGYRVGVSWSGEHQSYTVSLTCRNPGDPNNGLCMTSFARDIQTAVMLCVFKHHALANLVWTSFVKPPEEDYG